MISLKTQRLILRPFLPSDLEAFTSYRSDPDVARYQSWQTPFTPSQAAVFLAEMDRTQPGTPGEWYQFAVECQSQPGIIGDCAFQVLLDDPLQAQIGYTFAAEYQKQGFATEAVRGLLHYLFTELHIHRVTATCDAQNRTSIKLLERVGMRQEAHCIENVWFKGSWSSEYGYAILEREWAQDL